MKWWVLRDNVMSEQSYTRNELLHLDGIGPDTKVCRVNSNAWRAVRHDPALADFFESPQDRDAQSTASTGAADLRFIPRYFRLFAFLVDAGVLAALTLVVSLLPGFESMTLKSYCLIGFACGAIYFPLLESGVRGWTTVGKSLNNVSLLTLRGSRPGPVATFVRYGLVGLPLLLLGIAYDPALPHDALNRNYSLAFGLGGAVPLAVNLYLFYFNDPTYRFLQDYAVDTWVLPASTPIVPPRDHLPDSHWLPLGLTAGVALGLALIGWIVFWDLKDPPMLSVPSWCEIDRDFTYVSETDLIDRSRWRDSLLQGHYRWLEDRLTTLQSRYETGEISDVPLMYAMGVFGVVDPEVGRRINEWVIQNPESPFALLARAEYYFRQAAVKKDLYAGAAPDTNVLIGIRSDIEQARISLDNARRLNPDLSVALSLSLRLNRITRSGRSPKAPLKRAMELPRPSIAVWQSAMIDGNNRPVESVRDARSLLARRGIAPSKDQGLNVFCGIPAQRMAAYYRDRNRYGTAEKYYRQAMKYGSSPWVQVRRGTNAYRRDRPVDGLKFIERALEILPGQTEALRQKARIEFEEGFYSNALDAVNRALNREPRHPRLLYLYARILKRIGKPARARNQLRTVKKVAPGWLRTKEPKVRVDGSSSDPS